MGRGIALNGFKNLAFKRYISPFWFRRNWLKKTEWMSGPELHNMQLIRLKKLIRHAYNTVPFYHQMMKQMTITPSDIKTLADVEKMPIINKEDVLSAGDLITSRKYPDYLTTVGHTGGTTGQHLTLRRNLWGIGTEHAFARRQWDWAGIKLNDATAYLSWRIVVPGSDCGGCPYAYDPFMRELILSTYHLSPETATLYAEAMKYREVKAIVGYSSAISFLAKCCLDKNIRLNLKAALTTSETINDHMKSTIERAFNCRVYDFYGAAERVCYIFTCESGSYHLIPEYGLTELVPIDTTCPEMCKIVATGFWNWATPLIRYDTGDIVVTSKKLCACGRSFPVMQSIIGRTGDIIRTPSGKVYGPTLMVGVTKWANNILETQVIQDSIDHLTIPFVPNDKFSSEDMEHFKKLLDENMPADLKVDLVPVKSIDRTARGKLKFIVSRI